jgi:hypothetical protein
MRIMHVMPTPSVQVCMEGGSIKLGFSPPGGAMAGVSFVIVAMIGSGSKPRRSQRVFE